MPERATRSGSSSLTPVRTGRVGRRALVLLVLLSYGCASVGWREDRWVLVENPKGDEPRYVWMTEANARSVKAMLLGIGSVMAPPEMVQQHLPAPGPISAWQATAPAPPPPAPPFDPAAVVAKVRATAHPGQSQKQLRADSAACLDEAKPTELTKSQQIAGLTIVLLFLAGLAVVGGPGAAGLGGLAADGRADPAVVYADCMRRLGYVVAIMSPVEVDE
jgi:hypothetical protein